MSTLTEVQFIEKDGEPAFAVIPYDLFMKLLPEETTIPHEVVGLVIKKDINLAKAWRIHLGLTQAEVAKRAKISQAALSQMEKNENSLRSSTLKKLANAMGISVEQLRD